jgi:hypothetical protein
MVASMIGDYDLFDGYNSWFNNGDEVDGPGVNEPVWPVLFDTFVARKPLVVTEEMMTAFDTGCPDILIRRDNNTIQIPYEPSTIMIVGYDR